MPDEFGEQLTRDQKPFLLTESRLIHVDASSLQFSPLILYRVHVRGLGWPMRMLGFCAYDTF